MARGKLTEKQTHFIEKYVTIGKHRQDAAYVNGKRKTLYKVIHGDGSDQRKIAARKEVATVERHRLMAELAAMIEMAKPDLLVADRHAPMVDRAREVYKSYKDQIEAVREDQRYEPAEVELREIESEMVGGFDSLFEEILSAELEGGEPLADRAAGKSVVIWERDLGADLTASLSAEDRKIIEVGEGKLQIYLNEDILAAFAEDNDKVTPMALQGEVEQVYQNTLVACRVSVARIGAVRDKLLGDVRENKAGDDPIGYYLEELQRFASTSVMPEIVSHVNALRTDIQMMIKKRWKQVTARHKTQKGRKLKIVSKFVLPAVGIVVAGAAIGVAVVVGVVLTASGIGAVGGVGILLASVAAIRGIVSIAKNTYEQIASIKTLTGRLQKDLDALAEKYDRASSANEIAASVVNSFVVWPVMKCLPAVESRMDEIEMRVALVTLSQNKMMAGVEEAMAALEQDRKTLMGAKSEASAKVLDEYLRPAGDEIDKTLSKIGELGEKTLPIQEKFSQIRRKLEQLSSLVSDTVKMATLIIPIVTELAFLVANVAVGLAGAATSATALEQNAGAAMALIGEVADGAGVIDTAANS
ncbi:MAG: hypothetical protein ABJX32_18040 [Tateyamaria sp.]|uniref:hypothetical protein n=1 Tax=Tateyamaria sp. TaxID=1929288 RepID=UPI0032A12F7A